MMITHAAGLYWLSIAYRSIKTTQYSLFYLVFPDGLTGLDWHSQCSGAWTIQSIWINGQVNAKYLTDKMRNFVLKLNSILLHNKIY